MFRLFIHAGQYGCQDKTDVDFPQFLEPAVVVLSLELLAARTLLRVGINICILRFVISVTI
jgi:hypothetical protein